MPVANQWTRIEKIIPGETVSSWNIDNTLGLALNITLAAGTNWQTGDVNRWTNSSRASSGYGYIAASGVTNFMATVNGQFYLTGVQMEKGTIATGFERRSYGLEFGLCQRYYEKSFPHNVVPANDLNPTSEYIGVAHTTSWLHVPIFYKINKRMETNIITLYRSYATSGVWGVNIPGAWFGWTPPAIVGSSIAALLVSTTGPSTTAGYSYRTAGNWTVDSEL
jgi:hypothetical protein